MKKIIIPAILSAFCCCQIASAGDMHANSKEGMSVNETKVVYGQKYIDSLVVAALTKNSPMYFNAPGMPKFAVIGKDRKFYLGIGGYVKGTVSYDFGNPIDNALDFNPSAIPTDLRKGNKGLVQFGAGTSTININFVGLPGTKDQIGAYFDLNFSNPGNGLYMLNAYGTYRGFKVGYGLSLFGDPMAGPPTIDFAGPNSWVIIPNALIDYEYKWGKHWGVGAGLEMPIASYTDGEDTYTVNQRVPDIPFYIQYGWKDRSSWIRFSGIVRTMTYRDDLRDRNRNSTGWGMQLSGSAALVKNLTSFYQAMYGQGITSYYQDTYNLGLDMLPSRTSAGKLDNLTSWGGYFGLQYNFSATTFMSATYSMVRTSGSDAIHAEGQYRNGQYVVGNLFWNLAPSVQMGVEYLWGMKQIEGGSKFHNSRVQTMLQVNF